MFVYPVIYCCLDVVLQLALILGLWVILVGLIFGVTVVSTLLSFVTGLDVRWWAFVGGLAHCITTPVWFRGGVVFCTCLSGIMVCLRVRIWNRVDVGLDWCVGWRLVVVVVAWCWGVELINEFVFRFLVCM